MNGDMLAATSTMQDLCLECNEIGLEGTITITDALPADSSLTFLVILP